MGLTNLKLKTMKKSLLISLMAICHSYIAQIDFQPYANHSFEAYTAAISANGRIYYTTDGSDPTDNSASAMNTVNINITKTTVLKAKLATGQVYSKTFYYGDFPIKTVYFKPPSDWSSACSFANSIDPQTTVDIWGPGNPMTRACEGWYKSQLSFFKGLIEFNNCQFPFMTDLYKFYNITTEDIVFYDYSAGPITNPPACLLAVNDHSKKVVVVKIFPNPVQDFVNIESEKNFIAYEIIDETGKSLFNKDFRGEKIDIRDLKTGVYYIKLKSVGNDANIVKFIKK